MERCKFKQTQVVAIMYVVSFEASAENRNHYRYFKQKVI